MLHFPNARLTLPIPTRSCFKLINLEQPSSMGKFSRLYRLKPHWILFVKRIHSSTKYVCNKICKERSNWKLLDLCNLVIFCLTDLIAILSSKIILLAFHYNKKKIWRAITIKIEFLIIRKIVVIKIYLNYKQSKERRPKKGSIFYLHFQKSQKNASLCNEIFLPAIFNFEV